MRQHVFNSFFSVCSFFFLLSLLFSNDFVIVGLSSPSSSSLPSFILDSSFCLSHQSKDILLLLWIVSSLDVAVCRPSKKKTNRRHPTKSLFNKKNPQFNVRHNYIIHLHFPIGIRNYPNRNKNSMTMTMIPMRMAKIELPIEHWRISCELVRKRYVGSWRRRRFSLSRMH